MPSGDYRRCISGLDLSHVCCLDAYRVQTHLFHFAFATLTLRAPANSSEGWSNDVAAEPIAEFESTALGLELCASAHIETNRGLANLACWRRISGDDTS